MTILSKMWMEKQGRKIKVYDRLKTQSVNVCTPQNIEGEYEQVYYFREPFRTKLEELDEFVDLQLLVGELRERSYKQLQ
jgi:hypothetical protein